MSYYLQIESAVQIHQSPRIPAAGRRGELPDQIVVTPEIRFPDYVKLVVTVAVGVVTPEFHFPNHAILVVTMVGGEIKLQTV